MKRDLALCRKILETLEADEKLENTKEIGYHLIIMADVGFVDLSESHLRMVSGSGPRSLPDMARLTWKGHEVLKNIRFKEWASDRPVTPIYVKSGWDV